MKKILLLCAASLLSLSIYCQEAKPTVKGYEGVKTNKETDVLSTRYEQKVPAINVYLQKTETSVKPVYYKFNYNLLRTTNRVLLNKWLKESK